MRHDDLLPIFERKHILPVILQQSRDAVMTELNAAQCMSLERIHSLPLVRCLIIIRILVVSRFHFLLSPTTLAAESLDGTWELGLSSYKLYLLKRFDVSLIISTILSDFCLIICTL